VGLCACARARLQTVHSVHLPVGSGKSCRYACIGATCSLSGLPLGGEWRSMYVLLVVLAYMCPGCTHAPDCVQAHGVCLLRVRMFARGSASALAGTEVQG